MTARDDDIDLLAARALELVRDGQVVGLGTGRAATAFVRALAERVWTGLRVHAVATSEATAALARSLGIPLRSLEAETVVDLTVDGADEVDPALDLIKGYGGALLREKIVASASRRLVVLVGRDKRVPVLGARGKLPVEVVPFGTGWCERRLAELGLPSEPRRNGDALVLTDNGNHLLDCRTGPIDDPHRLDLAVRAIPGVVATGLFLGMAHTVLVQDGRRVETLTRGPAA